MNELWHFWAIAGILFWVVQIFKIPKPLFIAGIFGSACWLVTLFTNAQTPFTLQLLVFSTCSAGLTLSIKPIYLKYVYTKEEKTETNTAALVVGKTGIVIEAIDPITGILTIAIGGDNWRAVMKNSELDGAIGQKVIVLHVEGCTAVIGLKTERS